jgi:hypothetical protein
MQTLDECLKSFREEYKKAYGEILPQDLLKDGNVWFEDFISSTWNAATMAERERVTKIVRSTFP